MAITPDGEEVQWEGREPLDDRNGQQPREELYPKGCWNIPKIAGQVGKQIRTSIPRAMSVPRRLGRSVTPRRYMHESTAEELEYAGRAQKRAASTSPSRFERKRTLKDRLPRQIRSIIEKGRKRASRAPVKPSRRSGPVGKKWVKVYDDIEYMDDAIDDYFPLPGYKIGPVKIPDASPLPVAPTPPPDRESQTRLKKPTTSDQDLIQKEISQKRESLNAEQHSKAKADQELILREMSSKTTNGNEDEGSEQQTEPVRKSRDMNRYKAKKNRRSGTPAAAPYPAGDRSKSRGSRISVEEYYIIPDSIENWPQRPPRGSKIYDNKEFEKKEDTEEVNNTETDYCENSYEEMSNMSEPKRPTRGVKTYESVLIGKDSSNDNVNKPKPSDNETFESIAAPEEEINVIDDCQEQVGVEESVTELLIDNSKESEKADPPAKPKRGIKVYEDIIFKKKECDTKLLEGEKFLEETVEDPADVKKEISQSVTNENGLTVDQSLDLTNNDTEEKMDLPIVTSDTHKSEASTIESSSKTEKSPIIIKMTEKKATDNSEKMTESVETPEKPKRGVKVYEDIILKRTVDKIEEVEERKCENSEENKIVEIQDNINEATDLNKCANAQNESMEQNESDSLNLNNSGDIKQKESEGIEQKRKEIVPDKCEAVEKKESESMESDKNEVANLSETNNSSVSDQLKTNDVDQSSLPQKPARGFKVYSSVNIADLKNSNLNADENSFAPPYAKVQKRKDCQMIPLKSSDADSMPPIPPKKRSKHYQPVAFEGSVPPKPARHLKPKNVYNDQSNLNAKRIKVESEESIHPPRKPARSSKSMSKSKENINGVPLLANMTISKDKPSEIIISPEDGDSYENVMLKTIMSSYKTRPLPPTPTQASNVNQSTDATTRGNLPGDDSPSVASARCVGMVNSDTCVSAASDVNGVVCDKGVAVGVSGLADKQLDQDIECNLKNIENSFAALDTVLKSLKSYSENKSPSVLSENISLTNINDSLQQQDAQTNVVSVNGQPSADDKSIVNVEASLKFDPNEDSTKVSVDLSEKCTDSTIENDNKSEEKLSDISSSQQNKNEISFPEKIIVSDDSISKNSEGIPSNVETNKSNEVTLNEAKECDEFNAGDTTHNEPLDDTVNESVAAETIVIEMMPERTKDITEVNVPHTASVVTTCVDLVEVDTVKVTVNECSKEETTDNVTSNIELEVENKFSDKVTNDVSEKSTSLDNDAKLNQVVETQGREVSPDKIKDNNDPLQDTVTVTGDGDAKSVSLTMEGSTTSIADDDSEVSIVTVIDVKETEEAVTSEPATSEVSQQITSITDEDSGVSIVSVIDVKETEEAVRGEPATSEVSQQITSITDEESGVSSMPVIDVKEIVKSEPAISEVSQKPTLITDEDSVMNVVPIVDMTRTEESIKIEPATSQVNEKITNITEDDSVNSVVTIVDKKETEKTVQNEPVSSSDENQQTKSSTAKIDVAKSTPTEKATEDIVSSSGQTEGISIITHSDVQNNSLTSMSDQNITPQLTSPNDVDSCIDSPSVDNNSLDTKLQSAFNHCLDIVSLGTIDSSQLNSLNPPLVLTNSSSNDTPLALNESNNDATSKADEACLSLLDISSANEVLRNTEALDPENSNISSRDVDSDCSVSEKCGSENDVNIENIMSEQCEIEDKVETPNPNYKTNEEKIVADLTDNISISGQSELENPYSLNAFPIADNTQKQVEPINDGNNDGQLVIDDEIAYNVITHESDSLNVTVNVPIKPIEIAEGSVIMYKGKDVDCTLDTLPKKAIHENKDTEKDAKDEVSCIDLISSKLTEEIDSDLENSIQTEVTNEVSADEIDNAECNTVTEILRQLQNEAPQNSDGSIDILLRGEWTKLE